MPKLAAPLAGLAAILIVALRHRSIFGPQGISFLKRMKSFSPRTFWFAAIGMLVAVIIAIPASAKQGSAENYYFTFSFFAALSVMVATVWLLVGESISRIFLIMVAFGWLVNLAGVGSVLAGVNGKLSNLYIHKDFIIARQCLNSLHLPQPALINHPYLALPWMVPAQQHFVLQTSYRWDRAAGVKMEGGGLGGLIDHGYFASLALSEDNEGQFDGSSLERYELTSKMCNGFVVYRRKF